MAKDFRNVGLLVDTQLTFLPSPGEQVQTSLLFSGKCELPHGFLLPWQLILF